MDFFAFRRIVFDAQCRRGVLAQRLQAQAQFAELRPVRAADRALHSRPGRGRIDVDGKPQEFARIGVRAGFEPNPGIVRLPCANAIRGGGDGKLLAAFAIDQAKIAEQKLELRSFSHAADIEKDSQPIDLGRLCLFDEFAMRRQIENAGLNGCAGWREKDGAIRRRRPGRVRIGGLGRRMDNMGMRNAHGAGLGGGGLRGANAGGQRCACRRDGDAPNRNACESDHGFRLEWNAAMA
ncbi:MAG: hypothetical protein BWZ10_01246 [candidate division BRC1 bacterium ADurb.BinA364]|nr:MAG: hypothetical protein BWZ10_01246 [candidate division BRC1 bacterium ADurb.BinA364]